LTRAKPGTCLALYLGQVWPNLGRDGYP
jgi:hypothetical protein